MPRRERPNFEQLYSDFGERIYRFCYRLCGHAADAEDLTQDVFVLACRALPGFECRSSVTTWLYRIAVRRWQRVNTSSRLELVPLEEERHEAAVGADPSAGTVDRIWLEDALAELPRPLRDAFVLVKAEGLKYREAAAVLGIPQGTVQARVHEAGARLRALMAEDEEAVPAIRARMVAVGSGGGRP